MSSQKPYRILLTGGGSGGHVIPVLAVASALKEELDKRGQKAELLFVGRRKGSEEALVEKAGIPYAAISAGKLRRYIDLQNLVDPLRIMVGFFQALWIIGSFRPRVVFAKGGYVSLPVIVAAYIFRVPIVAHETDSILGLSNKFATKIAKIICTGYPTDCYQKTNARGKFVFTGNPVRKEFFAIDKPTSKKAPYTLLVIGGSQGARAINNALQDLIENQVNELSIIHVTGEAHYPEYKKYASAHYHPIAFTNYVADLMGQADLVVSRSGGSVFELAASARPTILIPLSTSANRHQQSNAEYFKKHGAAVVVDEVDLTSKKLTELINNLLKDSEKRQSLSAAIRKLSVPDAANKVAVEIISAIK